MITDHSNYDSFYWMDMFGDPDWVHHQQIAQLWGLAALRLASSPIAQFNATAYTSKLREYFLSLRELAMNPSSSGFAVNGINLELDLLGQAIESLAQYALRLDDKA